MKLLRKEPTSYRNSGRAGLGQEAIDEALARAVCRRSFFSIGYSVVPLDEEAKRE